MKAASADVQTFSIGFDDAKYDETEFALQISKHLGTKHRCFKVTPDAATELPRLAAAFGEPLGDSSALPTHYLARETHGYVKVALSGDGGDELFGGYDRYRAMQLSERLYRLPPLLRKSMIGIAGMLPGSHPKSFSYRIKRLAAGLNLPADQRYATYVRLFQKHMLNQLMQRSSDEEADALVGRFGLIHHQLDAVACAARLDRFCYLPNDLLTKVDRCSMLHGLEVRSPFMDHELVQFAAGLTTDQLLKGGPKRMLREAFADDLPAWVFKRKKMGFAVPIGDWFRGELRSMLRDTLFSSHAFGRTHFDMKVVERLVEEHETKRVDHSQRLYALLMLELWWETARK
jgi:asparagine synthase (glutamine-hydrolysing)